MTQVLLNGPKLNFLLDPNPNYTRLDPEFLFDRSPVFNKIRTQILLDPNPNFYPTLTYFFDANPTQAQL